MSIGKWDFQFSRQLKDILKCNISISRENFTASKLRQRRDLISKITYLPTYTRFDSRFHPKTALKYVSKCSYLFVLVPVNEKYNKCNQYDIGNVY